MTVEVATTSQTEPLLVPMLRTEHGPPGSVDVAAWHLALSNLVSADVPHHLLALWLFPDRGGVTLLAPSELAADGIPVDPPAPHLSQHQLFALEERIRQAGYHSVAAIPVRGPERDLGLALFAHLDAGEYPVARVVRLHTIVHRLGPTFAALAASPPISAQPRDTDGAVVLTELPTAIARAAAEGRTGEETLRLISGVLQTALPHARMDVLVPGQQPGTWALLSGCPTGRRWGESTLHASESAAAIVSSADQQGAVLLPDLRELAGTGWPSYQASRELGRIRAVVGVRLRVTGMEDAWMLLGGPSPGMFRAADLQTLREIAPIVALRVHGLRAQLEADIGRVRAETSQAAHSRAGRLAGMLAGTPHWGEALNAFVEDVRSSLGYGEVRFALRFGEDAWITVTPGDLKPLAGLPATPVDGSRLALLFAGVASFIVDGEEGQDLAVPLRVAGRVVGALMLHGGSPGSAGHPVASAQLFADLMAPHLELLRRAALRPVPERREASFR